MPVQGFRKTVLLSLVAALTLARAPLVAAAGGPNPTTRLFAQIIVSDGPGSSYLERFEGLGDVTAVRRGDFRDGVSIQRGQVHLFRALTSSLRDWWDWRQQALDRHARQTRRDVSLVLLDQTLTEVARWELKDAWPENLKVSLDADGSALEELVLAHGAISLVNPPPSSTP